MKSNNDEGAELPDQPESSRRRDVLGAFAASVAVGVLPGAAFAQGSGSPAKAAAKITDHDRTMLRDAWTNYCDALRREGEDIINGVSGDAQSPQELAEALRAVARIGIMSLQHRMDFNDPDFPTFFRSMDDRYKYGGPDTHINYLTATLRGDATYRLRANHHHREFNINVSGAAPVQVDGVTKLELTNREFWPPDLKIEPDGSFEVMFSSEKQAGNWVRLDPDFRGGTKLPDQYPMAVGGLLLRTYYWDPEDGLPAGSFAIDRVDAKAPLGPAPLTPARFVDQLKSATELCSKAAKWWIARPGWMRVQNKPNVISPPGQMPPGIEKYSHQRTGPLNYGVAAWDLAPDEVLFIESEIPECRYWSFHLYNAWWESPDIQHRQTSIGHKQAFVDADGRFRAVIAHADPGVPNWLDTGGARRGFLHYRWLRPTVDHLPTPAGKVVKLSEVRNLMPPEHPRVDQETRRARLSARRAYFAKRFQT